MATKREEARDALNAKIAEAAKELGTQGFKVSAEPAKLEAIARSYALVTGKSEPGKAW